MAQVQSQTTEERAGPAQGSSGQPNAQAGSSEVPGAGAASTVRGSSGGASLHFAPVLTVSERYDSNVLFSSRQQEDYVTNIRTGTRMNYEDDLVAGTLAGNIFTEVYVINPGLNYFGGDGSVNAVLDKAVQRIFPRLGLSLMGNARYTPEQPAFLQPDVPESAFIRGIQASRNNSLSGRVGLSGTYAMSPVARMNVSGSYQMIKFLDPPVAGTAGTSLFDSSVASFLGGPEFQIAPDHSINVSGTYQQMKFEPSAGGAGTGFTANTYGAMVGWVGTLSRELKVQLTPGFALTDTYGSKPQYTARTMVEWNDGRLIARFSYSRGIFPSFVGAAGAMLSDNVSLFFSGQLMSRLGVTAQTDYAKNRSLGSGSFSFESYGQTLFVNYQLSEGLSVIARVSYTHFTYETLTSQVEFPRQVAMLTLTKQWN